ncbi:MAG: hypothetical protein AB7V11_01390 [Pyrinomonadaceae bacterium]
MKLIIALVILTSGAFFSSRGPETPVADTNSRFMAFCIDGDGALTGWLTSRYDAYLAGREHERVSSNHRWEIWVQEAGKTLREPVCGRITDGSKPDTVKLENTCGRCIRFHVTRTNADGSVNAREFNIKTKKSRQFRRTPNSTFNVIAEADCPQ